MEKALATAKVARVKRAWTLTILEKQKVTGDFCCCDKVGRYQGFPMSPGLRVSSRVSWAWPTRQYHGSRKLVGFDGNASCWLISKI